MRSEYDFGSSVENPYVRKPHSQVTMNLDDDVPSGEYPFAVRSTSPARTAFGTLGSPTEGEP